MTEDDILELDFLRFYYRNVQDALGPADGDINHDIIAAYKKKTGNKVSNKYDHSEEDDG